MTIFNTNNAITFTYKGVKGSINGFFYVCYGNIGTDIQCIKNTEFRAFLLSLFAEKDDTKMMLKMIQKKHKTS